MNDHDDPYDDPFALDEPVEPKPPAAHDDRFASDLSAPTDETAPAQDTSLSLYATPAPPSYPPAPPGGVQRAGFACPACGYDLTGAVIGGSCPECGSHISSASLTRGGGATNGMAVTSMVLGICSLALCIFYGIFTILLAPMGIIFGHIARRQISNGGYSPGSNGYALTGLICSYVGLGLVAAGVLMVIILVSL